MDCAPARFPYDARRLNMILQLSNYEFLEMLPSGDLAEEVWKARRRSDGALAVVKVLPALPDSEGPVARLFLEEADRLYALRHPGLVAVLDVGLKGGRPFYAAEFIEGDTLGALAGRGPLAASDALLLAQGVAGALAYAWREARLFHGHLTPGNIWIDRQGAVRVADLGLARVLGAVAAAQGASGPRRHQAPHYAAPEQALPGGVCDFRADIYALGALLHHLLTGRVPFGDSSDAETLSRHVTGFLPDPRETRARVSDAGVWLLELLTAKDPAARPASWEAVLNDLAAVRAGRPPAEPRPASGAATVRRSEPAARRRSRAAAPARLPAVQPAPVFDRSGLSPAVAAAENGAAALARQRVVVSPKLRRQIARLHRSGARRRGGSFGLIVALAAAGFGFYRFVWPQIQPPSLRSGAGEPAVESKPFRRYGVRTPAGELVRDPSAVAPAEREWRESRPDLSALEPPSEAPIVSAPIPAPAPESPTTLHPLLAAGARDFNEAMALFKEFEKDRKSNGALLPRIERHAQRAAESFEAYQRAAPNDPNGRKYAEQSYRLISYARQWILSLGVRDDGRGLPPRRANPPPPRAPQIPTAVGLRLAPGWNAPAAADSAAMRELMSLIGARGAAAVNLAPDPALEILERTPYLMSARELARSWNAELPEGRPLLHPAFPGRSLKAFVIEREVQAPYPVSIILADSDQSVVGVQFEDDRPRERPTLPAALFAEKWTLYDLVGLRARERDDLRVAFRVRSGNRVLQIESELAEKDDARPEGLGRSLYRAKLILAQPIVDLMIFRLYAARGAPAG